MSTRLLAALTTAIIGIGVLALVSTPASAATPNGINDAQKGYFVSNYPVSTVSGCRVTVTTAATALTCGLADARRRIVKNCGTASIDLGASGVTTGTGFQLAASESLSESPSVSQVLGGLNGGQIYGITASGTVVVCVFEAN